MYMYTYSTICLEGTYYLIQYVLYAIMKERRWNISSYCVRGQDRYGAIPPNLHLVAVVLWSIWKARNRAIFRGREPEGSTIIESAISTQRHMEWAK